MRRVGRARHVHVHAGQNAASRGFFAIDRVSVKDGLAERVPVAQHHPVELPFALQDAAQRELVGRCGHAANLVEGAHHREATFVERGLERRQVHFAQRALGDVDRVVVASAFCSAVGHEVLGARRDRLFVGDVLALESAHAGAGHLAPQEDVLSGALGDSTPARIARDVDHGGERPVDTGGGCFAPPDTSGVFDAREVEARRLGERNGERGLVAVDDVVPEDDRDPEARLFLRDGLVARDVFGIGDVEQRANFAAPDQLVVVLVDRVELRHLTDLLVEGHLGEERTDALLDGLPLRLLFHGDFLEKGGSAGLGDDLRALLA